MPHLSCRAEDKDLTDYKPADLAMALCRMVSYNIAQLAYLNAKKEGINRIFFGGKYHQCHHQNDQLQSFEQVHNTGRATPPRCNMQAFSFEGTPERWRLSALPSNSGQR
jgi:pantothenate kinase